LAEAGVAEDGREAVMAASVWQAPPHSKATPLPQAKITHVESRPRQRSWLQGVPLWVAVILLIGPVFIVSLVLWDLLGSSRPNTPSEVLPAQPSLAFHRGSPALLG